MPKYQQLMQKFLGFACIVGPLLFFIGALFLPLGNQGIGGMIAPYGVALLIPVFMEIGRWIGQVQPRYGFVCTVLALLTTASSTAAMFTWATSEALVNDLALTHEEIGLYIGNDPYIFPFAILSALFPIMIMLLAVGLWRNRLGPRWVPALFVVGAVAFLIFVVGGYMEDDVSGAGVHLAAGFAAYGVAVMDG
jgi:hypothetical protein